MTTTINGTNGIDRVQDGSILPTDLAQPLTLRTAIAVTGTFSDFTAIPAWAKRVTLIFAGVSTNGSSILQVQLGTSGGIEASGYLAGASSIGASTLGSQAFSTGFGIRTSNASTTTYHGSLVLTKIDGNTWVANGCLFSNSDFFSAPFGGSKALAAAGDRVRLTTINGTDTFDAGTINILYEG